MAVAITASLYGAYTPRHVQVEVTGLTIGDQVSIVGVLGSFTWPVRGGTDVTATATQLILRDAATPINTAITYEATVNGTVYTSSSVTVTHDDDFVLTSLDGKTAVDVAWIDNDLPTAIEVDQHFTRVPGRKAAVMRYATAGGESGDWEFETDTRDATVAFAALLAEGAPFLVRTSGTLRDVPPVALAALSKPTHRLVGKVGQLRVWSVGWTEVADPLGSVPDATFTIADMNTVTTAQGGTIADLNAFIASLGGTIGDINRFDWESEAAP